MKREFFSGPIAHLAHDSQFLVVVQEIVGRLAVDTEEQIANGAQQRTFARFVGSMDDMKIAALVGKPDVQIGKRSKGRDV